MVAARVYGVHPALWCGRPDLVGCAAWTTWTLRLLHAEAEAQRHAERQARREASR